MGGGGALADAGGSMEVPRLTAMLRAFAPGKGSAGHFDISEQFIARRKLIEARKQQRQTGGADAGRGPQKLGAGPLPKSILGNWESAPKEAKADYEGFLQSVRRLSASELEAAALQEVAAIVWNKLSLMEIPDFSDLPAWKVNRELASIKSSLKSAIGVIDGEHVKECLQSVESLLSWQTKLNPKAAGKPVEVAAAGKKAPREFGADLPFSVPATPATLEDTIATLCTGSNIRLTVAGQEATNGAPGRPVPEAVREMLSSSLQSEAATAQQATSSTSRPPTQESGSGQAQVIRSTVPLSWLKAWVDSAASVAMAHTPEQLAFSVCELLLNQMDEDEIAAHMFDLLGEAAFEIGPELIQRKDGLYSTLKSALAEEREAEEASRNSGPAAGACVTVNTESDKKLQKMARKEQRKARGKGRAGTTASDIDFLSVVGFEALLEAEKAKADSSNSTSIQIGGENFALGDGNMKSALPKGTTRRTFKGYEQVSVPATKTKPPHVDLIRIEDMEPWAQKAFAGYKSLNRIQSTIYQTGFYSNENMLVCAPTGAGKTNIAMVAVLRELGQNMKHGVIQKSDFKIVYVAPMKALAAEVTSTFSKRLAPLGITVKELTGDMQLTKKELQETQMIVTTPEKWDVITRKGGDVSMSSLVRLLIIDEVHLLNDDRGAVIEVLVARTLRQVEASQSMIRIVGLSATLPNYKDVGCFLGVNPETGLYFFDSSYRPVPLELQFLGVSEPSFHGRTKVMNDITYQKVTDSLKQGHQAMVFVHSRKDTGKTARMLAEMASGEDARLFDTRDNAKYGTFQKDVAKSRNREVSELFQSGLGLHHAGMLRSDRTLTERLFEAGVIKVLCCTATLAWGVNLPTHTVIIKGTQLYDAQKGAFTDLGMLDVQQIFGRAGRPQYEDSGEGIIITTHNKLAHYLGMLTHQVPIESKFLKGIVDHLNAEVVLGTVTNVKEASMWMSYTYLFVRMLKNPLVYGIGWEELRADPRLAAKRKAFIQHAAQQLERSKMCRYDSASGNLYVTELGRVASHFYIKHSSIEVFNDSLKRHMNESEVLFMLAQCAEFENVAVREDEMPELNMLARKCCPYEVKGGIENKTGKISILLQAFVSKPKLESFSLIADLMYVSSNAGRIARALHEICLKRGWSSMADTTLQLCKCFELQLWPHQHPLRQFSSLLSPDLLFKMEDRGLWMEQLVDMTASDIGSWLRHPAAGGKIRDCIDSFPSLALEVNMQPITRTVLRVQLFLKADFKWKERVHGSSLRWLIWVEDSENEHIYHTENWILTKKMAGEKGQQVVSFTIPIFEPLPSQYYIRVISEDWLHAEAMLAMSLQGLILPDRHRTHTDLLDLDPLPRSALKFPEVEAMYEARFSHFNPIQTQAFHTLYHTDESVLLGAPTGSGKTISSELAILRLFKQQPDQKVVYIAPLKALVRERIDDWSEGLCRRLNKRMVELTGEYTPDIQALLAANLIICTPEKWDGISRNWQSRGYVKKVGLLIIDEIHLLGADRGPILEVIVSRMRYIASQTNRHLRLVGLSTALSNAQDLADWMGVTPKGFFNFKPSVRPVPLEAHIQGYPGKFYCPRMATMNKPAYAAIQTHSPTKPVLIFVSSRRQTRLTALDVIAYAAADERPEAFVNMSEYEVAGILEEVKDPNLRHTLQFGIGMHHAGLCNDDRKLAEKLFVERKIQVLVATSTLAWGVNTPAHLVIIKGTEFFDAGCKRYVDFPITDILQMMGRAGRPQYDKHGVAVIMVHEPKKGFYKKFLYEPFPVESSLQDQLADHINAEVVSGTITSMQDAMDYLTWTFFYRRLLENPSYYDLEDTDVESINQFLSHMIEDVLDDLEDAGCVETDEDGGVEPTTAGRVASYYYLNYRTMLMFSTDLKEDMTVEELLEVLCAAHEYGELPVRHNEDLLNLELAATVRWEVDTRTCDDPHTKANLLLQTHFGRGALPVSDYATDTKTVLDGSLRFMQAMVDVSADEGWLETTIATCNLIQCCMQGLYPDDPSTMQLPGVGEKEAQALPVLPQLVADARRDPDGVSRLLADVLGSRAGHDAIRVVQRLPVVNVKWAKPKAVPLPPRTEDSEASDMDEDEDEDDFMWELSVSLQRAAPPGGRQGRRSAPQSYAPKFPKVKEEGWWLLLGSVDTHELYALKRVSTAGSTTVRLNFPARAGDMEELEEVSLFLMSDAYLGLDQQYTIPVVPHQTVPPPDGVAIKSQARASQHRGP